jgi:hypothetical protein
MLLESGQNLAHTNCVSPKPVLVVDEKKEKQQSLSIEPTDTL